jgi:hypothetical protein
MSRGACIISGLLGIAILSGCPSFMSVQTARALDKGQLEVTEAASVVGLTQNGNGLANEGGTSPSIYFSTRYGLAEGWDIGAKLEPALGFIGTTTVQLVHGDVLDIALAPDVGFIKFPGPISIGTNASIEALSLQSNYTVLPLDVPILVGLNLPHDHQVVIGPRVSGWFSMPQPVSQPGTSAPPTGTSGGFELFAGGTAGVSFRASRQIRVMPEIDLMVPMAWTGEGSGSQVGQCGTVSCAPYPIGGFVWQFSVGITYGVGADQGYL